MPAQIRPCPASTASSGPTALLAGGIVMTCMMTNSRTGMMMSMAVQCQVLLWQGAQGSGR